MLILKYMYAQPAALCPSTGHYSSRGILSELRTRTQ